jgi:RHS repeat-associated protein
VNRRALFATLATFVLAIFSSGLAWATDTDGDGLSDSFEAAYGTNAHSSDTDGDSLDDYTEIFVDGTDPTMADTDGDGDSDGYEIAHATDPLDPGTTLDGANWFSGTTVPSTADAAIAGTTPMDGSGVNVVNGHLTYSLGTGSAKGVGLPYGFLLFYNSGWDYDGPFGENWATYLSGTATTGGGGSVTIWQPPYQPETFTLSGGSYDPPTGSVHTLVNVGGVYQWTDPGGLQYQYTSGKISAIQDRFGNTRTINYTTGVAVSETDSRGQTQTYAYYAGTGRFESLTMSDGRIWYFRYNPKGQLMRVEGPATTQFPSGITQEFRYTNGSSNAALNNNMIMAIDGMGLPWMKAEYDTNDRVTKQDVGYGYFLFDYTYAASQHTIVTDRNGAFRDWYWHSTKLTKATLVEQTNLGIRPGEGDYTTTWATDADGYVTDVTFPEGNGVRYTLNAVKLPTEIRKKPNMAIANAGTDVYESRTYDSGKYYGPLTSTDADGNVTSYTLNSKGQPTTVTFPTVTNVYPTVTATNTYSYNGDGTVLEFTDGEGYVTHYDYYGSGARKGRVQDVIKDYGGLNIQRTLDYMDWGPVKTVTDPNGNVTTYTVEAYGDVTEIDYPAALGYITTFGHNANLDVTLKRVKNISETGSWRSFPNSQWINTTYSYSMMDQVTQVVESAGSGVAPRTTTMTYDANQNLLTTTRDSKEVDNVWDERDLLYRQVRDPGSYPHLAVTAEYTYDGNRNVTAYKNGRNKTTTTVYDHFDRPTTVTNALGNYKTLSYDKNSRVTETKDYDAAPTPDVLMADHKTTYDELERPWKEEDYLSSGGGTWYARTKVFDKRNLVTSSVDRLSRTTTMTYDGAGRLSQRTDPVGNYVDLTYDYNGNVTSTTETEKIPGSGSTEAYVTNFAYDAINRQTSQTVVDRLNGANTKVTSWARDARNVVCTQTDPMGNVVTFTYDDVGRMKKKSEDLGSGNAIVTQWAYDQNNNVTSLTDDNGKVTSYAYDKLNRLTTKTYDNTKTVAYQYDAQSNVTRITDQIGSLLDYGYDDIDERTGCSITKGTGVLGDTNESWVYDAAGRMTQAADDDSIVNYTYNSLSQVLTEEQGNNPLSGSGKTATYTWNAENERTKVTYPSGFEARETRDDDGRLTEIKDQSNVSVAVFDEYGAGLRVKTTTFGNSTTSNYTYDGYRRPTDIAHKTSTPTQFAGYSYAYDANDNPLDEIQSHKSGHGFVYKYDKANRLTQVLADCVDPAGELAAPGTKAYADASAYNMDDVRNFMTCVVTPYGGSPTTTSYTTNGMNEYTAVGGVTHTYTDNGALKDDNVNLYKYDAHDHLVEVRLKSNNNLVASYQYDAVGRGRRIKKTVNSFTTRYVYADQQSIEELDDSNSSLLRLYAFGDKIDQVVMMEAPDQADVDNDANTSEVQRFFFHTQLIGSVTEVTSAAQTVVERYEYDEYGKITIKDKTGSTVSSSPIGNAYTYTGRQLDEETGLYFYRARQYSSTLRRFVQRDPLEYVDGPSAYAYCRMRPTIFTDPSGTQEMPGHWSPPDGSGGGGGSYRGPPPPKPDSERAADDPPPPPGAAPPGTPEGGPDTGTAGSGSGGAGTGDDMGIGDVDSDPTSPEWGPEESGPCPANPEDVVPRPVYGPPYTPPEPEVLPTGLRPGQRARTLRELYPNGLPACPP